MKFCIPRDILHPLEILHLIGYILIGIFHFGHFMQSSVLGLQWVIDHSGSQPFNRWLSWLNTCFNTSSVDTLGTW